MNRTEMIPIKAYYADYVNHMLKTYAHHELDSLQNDTDRTNWTACDKVIRALPLDDQHHIRSIYSAMSYKTPRPVPALVQDYCERNALDFERTMRLVRTVTKLVKKERGL